MNPGKHPGPRPSGRRLPLSFARALLALPLAAVALPFEYRRGTAGAGTGADLNAPHHAGDVPCPEAGLLAAILDSITDGVVVVDEDGTFLVTNPAARLILGVDHDAADRADRPEHNDVFRLDGTTLPTQEMPLVRALAGTPDDDVELFVRNAGHPDGIWISTTARPLDPRSGHRGAVVVFRDISDRKAAQQAIEGLNGQLRRINDELELRVAARTAELAAQAQQLKASNAELEAFSYSVSHDLRAPLRAVDGFAKVLATRYTDVLDEGGQRYLDKIRGGAQQMGHLIDGLLAFSRLQREALTREPFDVAGLVIEVWDELALARAGREVELTIAQLPRADADPRLVRHVLANLLSNAVKYTRTATPARIHVGSRPATPDGVSYFVRDNGVGFDMRYADKLFTVFQRMHRAEDYEGSGIGLALAARIVHRHGGRIWADARPDEGATFSFTLSGPDQPETAAGDGSGRPRPDPGRS